MKEQIIAYFRESPNSFISGQELSDRLGCTRTAVWKHIQELRSQGYRFESVPRRGYRLAIEPDKLSAARVLAACGPLDIVTELKLHDTLDSTQSEAHRLAAGGAPHGTLVIADSQSAGRGRHGRAWYSPAGQGVWMSLLVRPALPLLFAPQMTLVTVVALCRTVRQKLQLDAGIKWPNDLLVHGRKFSGILVDSTGEDELVRYMVIGVGIDCNLTGEDYPPELTDKATSLFIETGRRLDRTQLIADFLAEFDALYNVYMSSGFGVIRSLWESLSITLGQQVSIRQGETRIEGIAEAMDEAGALLVRRADGTLSRVYSGETGP